MHSSFVLLFAISSVASASLDIGGLLSNLGPAPENDPRWTHWQAPGPNDLRSACPGLNTLANHNFINHNGSSLTVPDMVQGLAAGMNMGADFTVFASVGGVLSADNPLGLTFDLSSINKHNVPIEHDASLSRQDAYFGNQSTFNAQNWQQYLSHFDGPMTDVKSLGAGKFSRFNDSKTRNPDFVWGPHELLLSYGESALYTMVLGGAGSKSAKVSYMRMLFEQERLPYSLGWRPSASPITLSSLGELLLDIYTASPEPVAEALKVTADSYKDVLAILAGNNADTLNELSQGLSSKLGL